MTKSFGGFESAWARVPKKRTLFPHSLTLEVPETQAEAEEKHLKASEENGGLGVYGTRLPEPILGKNFRLPPRARPHLKPLMDTSLSYIPVYIHLHIHPTVEIERPKMPELLLRAKHRKCMRDLITK
ncbi:WD repeat-containing protein on Y chromosome [Lutzomyia longipalpis]|uniref:WD repeat-containing protein on Y chromosome n=1 Tax=Lutzomyia longipalpis TaxID=7200 RepID=UPI002484610C|nr:WD repeat-containing protein on Y chromosome [Lutzomyia longipalpis]